VAPSSAVTVSQSLVRSSSVMRREETASTIVSELISSTNELTDVNGMEYTWSGPGPSPMRPR
jgi:hypothetical protein